MRMVINEREYESLAGQTILDVARAQGIAIPTLCHHPAVEPWGGCRLCVVEIQKPGRPDLWVLDCACVYPAEDGLQVRTHAERVLAARREILDLLWARCPEATLIRDLAQAHGLKTTTYVKREPADLCILCGICTRVCAAVGTFAISTLGRGIDKQVAVPFRDDPGDCIGCLTCALNCPTGAIAYEARAAGRKIWQRDFTVQACKTCGAPIGTPEQLQWFAKRSALPESYFDTCDQCRKQQTAAAFTALV